MSEEKTAAQESNVPAQLNDISAIELRRLSDAELLQSLLARPAGTALPDEVESSTGAEVDAGAGAGPALKQMEDYWRFLSSARDGYS